MDKKLYEIILVNNNCSDQTDTFCRDFIESNPEIHFKYLIEDNQGLSFARNKGIREAKGDILLFIDDDAYAPEKDYLSVIQSFFATHPDVASMGGKIVLLFEAQKSHWMTDFLMPLISAKK